MADLRRLQLLAQEQLQQDRVAGMTPLASIDNPDPEPMSDKGKQRIVSMTFTSAGDRVPHVVTVGPDATVRCTCAAMLSIETRPALCWAAVDFRRVVGLHAP